jgi:hypothetical protein
MIAFDLKCSRGHIFEGWFQNNHSFEKQNSKKQVSCPFCSNTKIRRIISPVATRISPREEASKEAIAIDYGRLAKEVVEYVHKNFDDVGHDFAKEALKMHYGVTERRNIRGSATPGDEKLLIGEKIEFFKIPLMKRDEDKEN